MSHIFLFTQRWVLDKALFICSNYVRTLFITPDVQAQKSLLVIPHQALYYQQYMIKVFKQ